MSAELGDVSRSTGSDGWPLRTVQLTITDDAGTLWTATGLLVRHPSRGRAAGRAGWTLAVVLLTGLTFAAPLLLGWAVAIVHTWWPTVPPMPYVVGLRLAALILVALVVRTVVAETIGFLVDDQPGSRPRPASRATP